MNKKNYIIIGVTAFVFIIAIILILVKGTNTEDWTTDILDANSYQITMTDCNERQRKLDNNVLSSLKQKWNSLSNNGPWTGDSTACYTNITISYDTNGIVREKQILLIDDSSLVLDLQTTTIYYTNASDIIQYLNNLFTK